MNYMTFDELVNWAYEAKFISKNKKEFEKEQIKFTNNKDLVKDFLILKKEIDYLNSIM